VIKQAKREADMGKASLILGNAAGGRSDTIDTGGGRPSCQRSRRRRSDLFGLWRERIRGGSRHHVSQPYSPQSSRRSGAHEATLLYTEELKAVNVIKRSTDPAKFAERIYLDVLS
jgi:hypothetical protein